MIPKIEFRYSGIYDKRYRESLSINENLKKMNLVYPSVNKIKNYIVKVEKIWKKEGKRILSEISKIVGLAWKEQKIIVYVLGVGRAFSDPVTVSILRYGNKNDFIDSVTHELIHQIESQNAEKFRKWEKKFLLKKYRNESITTKNHILLHAVHKEIFLKVYGRKRLNRQIKSHSKYPGYKRAWEIVEEEGEDNIIKDFHEVIKR